MLRTVAPIVLLLACGLALAGCRGSSSRPAQGNAVEGVVVEDATAVFVPQLNSFTEELLAKVEQAADKKAGVAEAQALLDSRREDLAALIGALKREPQAKARLLEAEVDNTDRVHRLQIKYAEEAARDPELRARLERFINDYDALFR